MGTRDFQEPDLDVLSGHIAQGRLHPVDDSFIAGVDVGLSLVGQKVWHRPLSCSSVIDKPRMVNSLHLASSKSQGHWTLHSCGAEGKSDDACLRRENYESNVTVDLPRHQPRLWHPCLPPAAWRLESTEWYEAQDGEFSYMVYTIFAEEPAAATHLVRVSAFLGTNPAGIHGFQFYFDDREMISSSFWIRGKEIPFLVDGPGGERLVGFDTLRSLKTGYVGLSVR